MLKRKTVLASSVLLKKPYICKQGF